MASPIALATALSRTRAIACPHCGAKKLVARRDPAKAYRACPRCKRRFSDPAAVRRKGRT